jgi:hypothetical protein
VPRNQQDLVITRGDEPAITVDDLEVAQFIYLLLNHRKIRQVITTMGERAVLLLGRFTEDRKAVLDAIGNKLRKMKYLPIAFEFDKVPGQDYTETIVSLASLARFIIADITSPRSVPQEAQAIIPNVAIPFVRIIQAGETAWSMAVDHNKYDWVLELFEYQDKDSLIAHLEKVVELAEKKHAELRIRKALGVIKARPSKSYRTIRVGTNRFSLIKCSWYSRPWTAPNASSDCLKHRANRATWPTYDTYVSGARLRTCRSSSLRREVKGCLL